MPLFGQPDKTSDDLMKQYWSMKQFHQERQKQKWKNTHLWLK